MFNLTFRDIDVLSTIEMLKGRDITPFLKDAGEYVTEQINIRMQAGVDVDGGMLKPNQGKYATWKEKWYSGKPPLTLTGELRESITETLKGDETEINVREGVHALIPHYPMKWQSESERSMTAIASRMEEMGRPFLGINDLEVMEIFRRFEMMFEPELQ